LVNDDPRATGAEESAKTRLWSYSLAGGPDLGKKGIVGRKASSRIGDGLGFLDPLYSSGVLLTPRSGEMAADAIAAVFTAGRPPLSGVGFHATFFVSD
jgi:hypothetical protein